MTLRLVPIDEIEEALTKFLVATGQPPEALFLVSMRPLRRARLYQVQTADGRALFCDEYVPAVRMRDMLLTATGAVIYAREVTLSFSQDQLTPSMRLARDIVYGPERHGKANHPRGR